MAFGSRASRLHFAMKLVRAGPGTFHIGAPMYRASILAAAASFAATPRSPRRTRRHVRGGQVVAQALERAFLRAPAAAPGSPAVRYCRGPLLCHRRSSHARRALRPRGRSSRWRAWWDFSPASHIGLSRGREAGRLRLRTPPQRTGRAVCGNRP